MDELQVPLSRETAHPHDPRRVVKIEIGLSDIFCWLHATGNNNDVPRSGASPLGQHIVPGNYTVRVSDRRCTFSTLGECAAHEGASHIPLQRVVEVVD